MLTTHEIEQLNYVRESFYSIDWNYGEVFDSNFIDALTTIGITFPECLSLAKEDTNTYLTLQEEATGGTIYTPRQFDA